MSPENPPIKRCSQLAILSREHHDALQFCWKIRQGLGNGTDEGVLRDYTLSYWRTHMVSHFRQEEKVLLPYIQGQAFADQLLKEHEDIRELILALDKEPSRDLFSILALFVTNHIRFEERTLFSYLEKILTPAQLERIAEQLLEVGR